MSIYLLCTGCDGLRFTTATVSASPFLLFVFSFFFSNASSLWKEPLVFVTL